MPDPTLSPPRASSGSAPRARDDSPAPRARDDSPAPRARDDSPAPRARDDQATRAETRQRELGARLRRLRGQQDLSLAQVEERSGGRWKAVVVGAYERGDRAVTIGRLSGLADFYGVPLSHLLPEDDVRPADRAARGTDGLLLDVVRLLRYVGDDGPVGAVARFAARIRHERSDHGGQLVTLRGDDARTLALAAGVEPADLQRELEVLGLFGPR